MQPNPVIAGVYETVLYGTDLDALRIFYAEVLGLEPLSDARPRGMAFRAGHDPATRAVILLFNPALTRLAHETVPSHGAEGPGHVAFAVAPGSLPEWRAHFAAMGLAVERTVAWPTGAASIYVRDPAGNSVELADGRIWPLTSLPPADNVASA